MAIIKKFTNNKILMRLPRKGNSWRSLWECKLVQPLRKTVWRFLKKVKLELPYDSAIPLLSIHLKKKKTKKKTPNVYSRRVYNHQDVETTSVDINRWMDKKYVTHTHTGILLSYKKKGIAPFAATWIDLEDFMLSEMLEKEKYPLISLVGGIWKWHQTSEYNIKAADSEIQRTSSWSPVGQGWRGGGEANY